MDDKNICPTCGHSGKQHLLIQWEYFKCVQQGCDCRFNRK